MEQLLYERPREKLRYRGASTLSMAELFQIVIGSGNSKVSGARIARNITRLVEGSGSSIDTMYVSTPTYADLIQLGGLGDAKVCQVLAVLELAKRLSSNNESQVSSKNHGPVSFDVAAIRRTKQQMIIFETYNGAHKLIKQHEVPKIAKQYIPAGRRMFAEAIADGAASISIALGFSGQLLEPSSDELSFIKTLLESAKVLTIHIDSVWLVNKYASIDIKKQVL